MRRTLLAGLLLLSFFSRAQYTWQALPSAPISYRFDDFYFINPDTGWAINPIYNESHYPQPGRVFRTYDGGNTWQQLVDSSHSYYRSVGFADAQTGWIGNLADTALYGTFRATTDTIPMYETRDGGVTWTPVHLPQPHPLGICGISVVTDSIVYAYGRFFGPAGYVKTTDKGATWTFVSLDSMAFGLIDGHFFNKDTGFITGMGYDHKAVILFTNNGGASWSFNYHSHRSDSDRVWKIYFPSRNTGYASIEYGGLASSYNTYFLKSTDGGQTWTEHSFVSNYNEEGIGFINDSVGWIGGAGERGTYKTTDGGNTWLNDETFGLHTPPYTTAMGGFKMNRFRSFGDTLMYASGNTLYKLKVASTGIGEVAAYGDGISNAPNPFKTETTITYDLNAPEKNVVLEIKDMTGRTVFIKNAGPQRVGKNHLYFHEQIPPGLYYYLVSGSQFRAVNTMVVIH